MAGLVHHHQVTGSTPKKVQGGHQRSREPPTPIGKGAGRPMAWPAKLQQQALDVFIPEENPPPLASILLAPET